MKTIRRTSLAAVLATMLLAALGVGSASASELISEDKESTYLQGVIAPETPAHTFNLGGFAFGCNPGGFSGVMADHATPEFSSYEVGDFACTGGSKVQMNGCQLSFDPGEDITGGKEEAFDGTFDIGPAGCGPVTSNYGGCSIAIYPKSGLAAEFHNEGSGSTSSVRIDLDASALKYTRENVGCKGSGENGTYTGSWLLKGFNSGTFTQQVGIHVESNIGIFMSGSASESPASQPKLNAESFPVRPTGDQDAGGKHGLMVNNRTTSCEEVHFESEATAATNGLDIEATYDNCTSFGLPSAIDMNSCHYTLDVLNAGPPYAGTMGVACANEGDAIEIRAYNSSNFSQPPVCKFLVGAQAGAESVALSNVGEGHNQGVLMQLALNGLKFTVSGPILTCGTNGARTGTYNGSTTLFGLH